MMQQIYRRIARMGVRIWRWKHFNGFGIQSPTDYAFVCNIVYGRAYREASALPETLRRDKTVRGRIGSLLYRIADFWKPDCIVNSMSDADYYSSFLFAAVSSELIVQTPDFDSQAKRVIYCLSPQVLTEEKQVQDLLSHAGDGCVVLVDGTSQRPIYNKVWKRLVQDDRVRISFDLYDVGIAFFDPKRVKQHYKINF